MFFRVFYYTKVTLKHLCYVNNNGDFMSRVPAGPETTLQFGNQSSFARARNMPNPVS